jgi:glycosyltransferase involved in cell wall biosynthesis
MKVALVYRLDHPGGIQSCCFSLIKGLNQCGITPDILWDVEPDWSLLQSVGARANFRYIRFPIPSRVISHLPDSFRYMAGIANSIDGQRLKEDYDFFYIFYNGFLLKNGTPHVRYLAGPPLLPQLEAISPGVRGYPFKLFKLLYKNLFRRFSPVYEFHPASCYVTISEFTSALFEEAYEVNLPIIHPPIDFADRHFDCQDIEQRDTITYFSRFADYKRPEWILELAKRHKNHRYVFMGGVNPKRRPYFESLKAQASKIVGPEIQFLDNPSNQKVRQVLARTRFYVFPTKNEHFGMTTPEAIASGAIPFTHDSGGQREIVIDPRLRFLDKEYLQKFKSLVELSDLELNNIRKSLLTHIQQYSEEIFITKMLSFLR